MNHWKHCLLIGFLLAGMTALAADLTLNDGTVYRNAELKKVIAGCVQITHDGGSANIELAALPDNFIAALSATQRHALQNMADLKLSDGTLYRKSSIAAMHDNVLEIIHAEGKAQIPADKIPAYYFRTFTARQKEELKQKSTPAPAASAVQPVFPGSIPPAVSAPAVQTGTVAGKDAQGNAIYVGPRGGKYILKNGKKVYVH